jgi:hypothetical protein
LQTAYGLDLTWIQMKKNSGFQPRRGLEAKMRIAGVVCDRDGAKGRELE